MQGQEVLSSPVTSTTALGSTQPPTAWVRCFFLGGNAVGAWSWPFISI